MKNNWRQNLLWNENDLPDGIPSGGFIPTNQGMQTPEDLVDNLMYSSYATNRDLGISSDSWKRMINYGLNDVNTIQENNAKVDAMEHRYIKENTQNMSLNWAIVNPFIKIPSRLEGEGKVSDIDTSYVNLVSKLGMPSKNWGEGGKSRVEWYIKYQENGVQLCIYDYKDRLPIQEVRDWHIGASYKRDVTGEAVKALKEYLES